LVSEYVTDGSTGRIDPCCTNAITDGRPIFLEGRSQQRGELLGRLYLFVDFVQRWFTPASAAL